MTEKIATWLVRSKVTPPRQLLTLVNRELLLDRLDEGAGGSLILLEAPGGYGKSSLLTQWRHRRTANDECVAWLSIDEDDDIDTFLAYLAFSAYVSGVDIIPSGLLEFQSATEKNVVQSIYKFLACIEQHNRPVQIILDDCERLSPTTRDAVVPTLLRRMPENASLVLASRESIPISTVDIDHRGLVTKVGVKDLRFSHAEMSELWKGRLTERQMTRLQTQTEGWPVLVRLLLAAAEIGAFDIRHLDEVSHSDSSITNYFEQKILSRLSAELRELLLSASIFEDVTDDVLTSLLEIEPNHALRKEISVLESFVAPLASGPGGFRIHPMMRDYLSYSLKTGDREKFDALHARAARWYSNVGNQVRAVRHAIATDDRDFLLEILEATGGLQLWLREGLVEFRVIDRLLANDVVLASPHMGIMRAIILMKSGKQAEAGRLYSSLLQNHGDQIAADAMLSLSSLACRIMLSVYRGHYLSPEDIAKFEFALEHSAISTQMFDGYLLTIKCVSAHQSGWFTDSIENSKNAIEVFRKDGSAYGEYYIHLHLAMIGGLMDDSQLKERGFAKARELTRCELSYDDIARTPYQILSQECEHEATPSDLANLEKIKTSALSLLRGEGWIDIYAAACRTLSEKIYISAGVDDAISALETFSEFAARNDMEYLADIADAQRAFIFAIDGRRDKANCVLRSAKRISSDPDNYISVAPWRAGEVIAEAALAAGGEFGAMEIWSGFRDRLLRQGNRRVGARLSTLLSCLQESASELAIVDEVISPNLQRSVFFCGEILRSKYERDIESAYPNIAKVLSSTTYHRASPATESKSIFSEKEIRVLQELATGKSDKEIALALDVTEHGVRYHLKNIYVKLNAGNRTDAVVKAQSRGVIPSELA